MASPIPKRPIQGVLVDVDGTLTSRGRLLNFDAAKALRELDRRGIPVILATGNVLPIALALHRFIGLQSPIIAENGGLVYFHEDRIVHLARKEMALKAYEQVRAHVNVKRLFTDRWRETEVALEPTVDVREILPWISDLDIRVESTGFAIHLTEPSAGKLAASRLALEATGLVPEDCLVAGDGDNDVELLKVAAVGVSFPEAMPAAKEAAGYVAKARDGDGLVEALRHFGLLV